MKKPDQETILVKATRTFIFIISAENEYRLSIKMIILHSPQDFECVIMVSFGKAIEVAQ